MFLLSGGRGGGNFKDLKCFFLCLFLFVFLKCCGCEFIAMLKLNIDLFVARSLAHLHTCTLAHLYICIFVYLHTCTLAHLHSPSHPHTHSLTHSLTYSLTHPPTHAHSPLSYSLTHSLSRRALERDSKFLWERMQALKLSNIKLICCFLFNHVLLFFSNKNYLNEHGQ